MTITVAGIGACTAVGYNAAQSAAAVRAGIANVNEHRFLVDLRGQPMVLAAAAGLGDDMEIRDRLARLLTAALADLAQQVPNDLGPLPLILGLPAARPGLAQPLDALVDAAAGGRVAGLAWSRCEIRAAGHAAGLIAIARAAELLNAGVPLVLVAAVDSWLQVDTLEWLDAQSRLHAPGVPWGLIPGEAGVACLLGRGESIAAPRLRRLGNILAAAARNEPHPLGSTEPCIGTGLTDALHSVLATAPEAPVGVLYTDLNGERHRADEAGFACARIADRLATEDPLVTPADCWGDVGAASGILGLMLAIRAQQRGYGHWRHALVSASSDGPQRAALLFEAPSVCAEH